MPSPVSVSQIKAIISDPTASLCGNLTNTLLKFPALFYQFYNWLFNEDGTFTDEATDELVALTVQTGDIKMHAGATVPDGWLVCNGQAVVRATYPALFTEIGETFGAGDASTTFNVPDLRDRFPLGASNTKALATNGGVAVKRLAEAEMPVHTHLVMKGSGGADTNSLVDGGGAARGFAGMDTQDVYCTQEQSEVLLQPTGGGSTEDGGQEFSILNPYVALTFLIKT